MGDDQGSSCSGHRAGHDPKTECPTPVSAEVGFASLPEGFYEHAHNIYIQYAAERGIPATLFIVAAMGMALYMRPEHSVGDYYYALSAGLSAANLAYCCRRFARSVLTRYHAAHPWWIGPKLIGELRGALWGASGLAGPRLLQSPPASGSPRH